VRPLFELVSHDSDKWQEAKRIINSLASERDSSFEIQISRKGENELMIRVNKQEKEKDQKNKISIHINAGLHDLYW